MDFFEDLFVVFGFVCIQEEGKMKTKVKTNKGVIHQFQVDKEHTNGQLYRPSLLTKLVLSWAIILLT